MSSDLTSQKCEACTIDAPKVTKEESDELMKTWGKVTVKWWSHKINGLHKNDFICAAKTDLLLN